MDSTALYNELYSDPAALGAYQALTSAGGHVYIVGGAVRDAIIGKKPKDVDLLVSGLDSKAISAALDTLPGYSTFAGKNFGVFHYNYKKYTVEIAMPRTETSTGTGHKDFAVKVDPNLGVEDDLARRDFTANAMAFDIDGNRLVDPYDGQADIENKQLRLVNSQAFKDDPLRIVRALVSYSVHGLTPDEYTLDEMTENASRIRHLPPERIQNELDKLLSGSDPAGAIEMAYNTGVLEYICPELYAGYEFDQQSQYHDLSVGEHSLQVLRYMVGLTTDPDVRLAALLHDIGKPDTFWEDADGYGHFYQSNDIEGSEDHEDRGAQMAYEFMKRMRYPNARIDKVVTLIQHHMFPYFTSEKGARKFINKVGDEHADDLMNLRESDSHGKRDGGVSDSDQENIDVGRALLDKVRNEDQPMTAKDLAINGHDLIQLGIEPGPQMGDIMKQLLQAVLEDPSLNDRETLIQYVKDNLL